MARRPLIFLLIGLLALCPALCGAEEAGIGFGFCMADGPDRHDAKDHQPNDAPPPCPEDGGSCICGGAITLVDGRVDAGFDLAPLSVAAPIASDPNALLLCWVRHHLTRSGSPTGLAGVGDPARIRALLQHIRC